MTQNQQLLLAAQMTNCHFQSTNRISKLIDIRTLSSQLPENIESVIDLSNMPDSTFQLLTQF